MGGDDFLKVIPNKSPLLLPSFHLFFTFFFLFPPMTENH